MAFFFCQRGTQPIGSLYGRVLALRWASPHQRKRRIKPNNHHKVHRKSAVLYEKEYLHSPENQSPPHLQDGGDYGYSTALYGTDVILTDQGSGFETVQPNGRRSAERTSGTSRYPTATLPLLCRPRNQRNIRLDKGSDGPAGIPFRRLNNYRFAKSVQAGRTSPSRQPRHCEGVGYAFFHIQKHAEMLSEFLQKVIKKYPSVEDKS
ncbi:hypothetical protein C8F04DRAFT_245188 [Mycena alexandri]|uniref:Uncharacterized protein n=1 Tax=Mycena alexandri TaxID=1745969 RepID=A0AAD6S6F4_9AGAR|nr:hypothetical protein C8F04DRAFT_245188 [Mycena alexandri]